MLSVIILTHNEAVHLDRCLASLITVSDDIHVVDSYSQDETEAIARSYGAHFVQHPFVHNALQFQWGLDNCNLAHDWVMKMDADEYLEPALIREIQERLPGLPDDITGIYLKRKVIFKGRWIRHGGFYPHILLRIWKRNAGSIEQRWMDEHPVLSHGRTVQFREHLVDCNLNGIQWWVNKHNDYAIREMVDLLNLKYHILEGDKRLMANDSSQAKRKRWIKEKIYAPIPPGLRAFLYFVYRYILNGGFLDGYPGFVFHVMQGFWYRLLVDVNLREVERQVRTDNSREHILAILRQQYQLQI